MLKLIIASGLVVTVCSFTLSFLAYFGKKDVILNKTYMQASAEERKNMDIKAYRKQTAIFFFLMAIVSLLNTLMYIFQAPFLRYISLVVLIIAGVYYIVSNRKLIEQNKK